MESSETQKRIIKLGEKLVKEVELEPGVDALARWMAHYIAEQMEVAGNATGEDKLKAEHCCFEAILKLWEHRSSLPDGRRPFENFEPIFRTLEKLDPENRQTYYFDTSIDEEDTLEPDNSVKKNVQQWLNVAIGIDQAIRIWLEYVFKQAAQCATDEKTKEWLINSIGLEDTEDTSIIIDLLDDIDDVNIGESERQKVHELIIARIERLKAFSDFNQELLSIYQQELEEISVNEASVDENNME